MKEISRVQAVAKRVGKLQLRAVCTVYYSNFDKTKIMWCMCKNHQKIGFFKRFVYTVPKCMVWFSRGKAISFTARKIVK